MNIKYQFKMLGAAALLFAMYQAYLALGLATDGAAREAQYTLMWGVLAAAGALVLCSVRERDSAKQKATNPEQPPLPYPQSSRYLGSAYALRPRPSGCFRTVPHNRNPSGAVYGSRVHERPGRRHAISIACRTL